MEVRDRLQQPRRHHPGRLAPVQGAHPLTRRLFGWAFAGLLLVTLTGSPAVADGGACPAGEACLLVTLIDGSGHASQQKLVTAQELNDWGDLGSPDGTQGPDYQTHTGDNRTVNGPSPTKATSITALLQNVGFPANVTFVTARADIGASATRLSGSQLTHEGYQGNQYAQPGFWADEPDHGLIRFARPMRSADDVNGDDVWTTRNGGQATLEAHTEGDILRPDIAASANMADAGAPLSFSVTYDGAVPANPTYAWKFGDGASAGGATPGHTWSTPGSYYISLDVAAADGSEGTASPILVTVGPKPPATGGTKPGTGSGAASNPATGPVKAKGKTQGSTTAQGSTVTGAGTATGGTTGTGTSTTPGTTKQPGAANGKPNAPAAAQTGAQVSGTLLVNPAVAVTSAAPATPAPAASARAVPRPQHDWRLLWILVLPGLLLLGAAGQSRWLQHRLPAVPWRVA